MNKDALTDDHITEIENGSMLGKVLAGLTAITSIAIVAMPAGIMAAAFSDAFQGMQNSKE